jgi:hypothetical protein
MGLTRRPGRQVSQSNLIARDRGDAAEAYDVGFAG